MSNTTGKDIIGDGTIMMDSSDGNVINEPKTPSSPLAPYNGDTFGTQGTYVDGMLYLSRMKLSPNNKPTAENLWGLKDKLVDFGVDEEEMQKSFKQKLQMRETKTRNDNNNSNAVTNNDNSNDTDEDDGNHPDNDQDKNIIDEEVSSSVFSDEYDDNMSEDDEKDIESKREVAAALRSLMKNPEVQTEVLSDGLIQAFENLSHTHDSQIRKDCAEALCFLTCNPTTWSKMIEDGAIPALLSLSHVENNERKSDQWRSQFALIGLANLSCKEGTESNFVVQNSIANDVIKHVASVPRNRRNLLAISRLFFNLCNVDITYIGLEQLAATIIRLCKTSAEIFNRKWHIRKEEGTDIALHAARGGASMPLTLRLSCADLPQMDEVSGSDPMVVVRQQVGGEDGPWLELGRTEVISNATTCSYKTKFHCVYNPGEVQNLMFLSYDIDAARAGGTMRLDLAKQDFIGQCTCTLEELIMSHKLKVTKNFEEGEFAQGTLTVKCTPQEPAAEDIVDSKTREYCLGALYLLAHIEGMPMILLHDGILSVMRTMLQTMPPTDRETRLKVSSVIASTLYVLSISTRTCWLMVEQGLFQLIDLLVAEAQSIGASEMALSTDRIALAAEDVMCMCVGTYSNVAFDDRSRWRMLLETPATTIILMCSVSRSVRVKAGCALVIQNMSSEKDPALKALSLGALTALIHMAAGVEMEVQRACFSALCALLACPFEELYTCLLKMNTETLSRSKIPMKEGEDGKSSAETVTADQIEGSIMSILNIFDILLVSNKMGIDEENSTKAYLVHTIRNIACSERGRDILLEVKDRNGRKDRVLKLLLNVSESLSKKPKNLLEMEPTKEEMEMDEEDLVLAIKRKKHIVRQVADALYNISLHKDGKHMMLYDKLIMSYIVTQVSVTEGEDSYVVYMYLAILYSISPTHEACKQISHVSGMNKAMIGRALNASENETSVDDLCSAMLCRMCENKRSVEVLVRLGLFPALIALAHTPDRSVRERCVLTISIMADSDIYIRKAMVDQGALPVLMEMAGSHDPRIRQNSVAALCELTSCKDVKQQMVDQGSVKALVLTGLIRASEDDPETCNSCCKALYNLLSTEDRFEKIVADGVVWALTAMLGLTKEMRVLGIMGLCNIASHRCGRDEMSNANTLKALTNLAMTRNPSLRPTDKVRGMCALALHNLSTGSVEDQNSDPAGAEGMQAKQGRSNLTLMAQHKGIAAISDLSHLPDAESKETCTAALAVLACNGDTQEQFILEGGLVSLVNLSLEDADIVGTKCNWAMKRNCAIASYSISTNMPLRKRSIRDGAMELLHSVLSEPVVEQDIRELCCRSMELFARDILNLRSMAKQGAIEALATAVGLDYDKIMQEQGYSQNPKKPGEATFLFKDPDEKLCTIALIIIRTICRLSCGVGAPCADLVNFGGVAVLQAMTKVYYDHVKDNKRMFQQVEIIRKDIALAFCGMTYSGDIRRIVREGGIACLIQSSLSNDHLTQELVAIAFHNLATNESNHTMLVNEGVAEALIQLGRRARTTTTLRYVASSLCSFSMGENVRELMAKTKCAKALSTLYTLLKTMSTDEVTPRYVALALSNLSRVPGAQREIVKILDIVPLITLASNVNDAERAMLELRERISPDYFKDGFANVGITGEGSKYLPPKVSSRMRGMGWNTHDFDPHRTQPREPVLPSVIPTKRGKLKRSKKKKKKEQTEKPQSPKVNGRRNSKNNNKKKEEKDVVSGGRVSRYAKIVNPDGPHVLTNKTLEDLVKEMFKRHFTTVAQLDEEVEKSHKLYRNLLNYDIDQDSTDEDDMSRPSTRPSTAGLYGESNNIGDANIEEKEEKISSSVTFDMSNLHGNNVDQEQELNNNNIKHGKMEQSRSILKKNEETAENNNIEEQYQSKEYVAEQIEQAQTNMYNDNPMPSTLPPRVAVTPTVRVATAAKSAIRVAEMERNRRKKSAQQFVNDMRNRAETKRAKQDAQLRRTLLEHTYRWAMAERDRINMTERGVWNGILVGEKRGNSTRGSMAMSLGQEDVSNGDFTSVPKFMADGLERLIRTASRSSTINGGGDGSDLQFPMTPLKPLSVGSIRGITPVEQDGRGRSKNQGRSIRRRMSDNDRFGNNSTSRRRVNSGSKRNGSTSRSKRKGGSRKK